MLEGDNIYRVKTFDIDGNVQVSNEIKIDYKQIDRFTIFPNPADVECHIDLSNIVGQSVDISLITPFGKVVRVENIVSASDQYLMSLDNIENGYYFIKIQAKGKRAVVQKLIIAK